MNKSFKTLGIILIAFSLIFGFLIRLFAVVYFTNFTGDQINDAYRVLGIWQGSLPTLGPGPTAWKELGGDIYLPPLYYYLVFPFTVLTFDLSSQAIPNAFFTFLSIPLLIFTVYKLLDNVRPEKRFFLSAIAGFWYSLLFRNIALSTGDSLAGNPVSILFFLLVFILLYTYQLEGQLAPAAEVSCWIAYGVSLAILTNLHFSSLFVMPAIFLGSIIFYIARKPQQNKRWLLAGLAIAAALLALTPYWIGEVSRDWENSRRILSLAMGASSQEGHSVTFLQRLNAIILGYLDLGKGVYFMGNSWKTAAISLSFLLVVFFAGIFKFKGNKTIFFMLISVWIVFLLAYSSTDMTKTYNPVFYKLLIYLAPIFLAICSLAYLDFSRKLDKLLVAFIIFGMTISILINVKFHYNYVSGRWGMPRIPNTSDIAEVIRQIPEKSTFCVSEESYRNLRIYEYTNQYITKRNLKFIPQCQSGDYFIYEKYQSVGDFTMRQSPPFAAAFDEFAKQHQYTLYKDTPIYYIYRVK